MKKGYSPLAELLGGGDLRSLGRAPAALARLRLEPGLVSAVVPLLDAPEPAVAMRAADVLEKFSRTDPARVRPFKRRLLGLLARATRKEVRWHLAQMLPRLGLSLPERRRACRILERDLESGSSIVRAGICAPPSPAAARR